MTLDLINTMLADLDRGHAPPESIIRELLLVRREQIRERARIVKQPHTCARIEVLDPNEHEHSLMVEVGWEQTADGIEPANVVLA